MSSLQLPTVAKGALHDLLAASLPLGRPASYAVGLRVEALCRSTTTSETAYADSDCEAQPRCRYVDAFNLPRATIHDAMSIGQYYDALEHGLDLDPVSLVASVGLLRRALTVGHNHSDGAPCPAGAVQFAITSCNAHLLVLAAVVLAAKSHGDFPLSMPVCARVGGVRLQTLLDVEAVMFSLLRYDAALRVDEFAAECAACREVFTRAHSQRRHTMVVCAIATSDNNAEPRSFHQSQSTVVLPQLLPKKMNIGVRVVEDRGGERRGNAKLPSKRGTVEAPRRRSDNDRHPAGTTTTTAVEANNDTQQQNNHTDNATVTTTTTTATTEMGGIATWDGAPLLLPRLGPLPSRASGNGHGELLLRRSKRKSLLIVSDASSSGCGGDATNPLKKSDRDDDERINNDSNIFFTASPNTNQRRESLRRETAVDKMAGAALPRLLRATRRPSGLVAATKE